MIAGQSDYGFMLISSAFAKPCLEKNPLVLGQISFQFTEGSSTQVKIQQLEQDLALQVGSIQPTLPIVDNQVSSILAIVLVVLFIMLMGYLLIYNVLYLSISRDIRFYGLLKALGTSAKQIRKIVVSQALLLSGIGIVLGLVLGGYLSVLFVPTVMASTILQKATTASTNPLIFLGAAVFSLITVVLSTRKPAAMAAKITPIAAMKYTEKAVYHNHKKTSFGFNLMLMAWRNVFREQKRAKTVLISLSLGITVFLVTSSLLSSMDLKNFVKSSLQHDFELQNTTINKEVGNGLLDKFDENVIEEIQKIPSIQNLTMITSDLYTVAYDEGQFSQHIDDYLSRFPYYTSKKSDYGQGDLYGALLGIDSAIVIEFNKKTANPVDLATFEKGEIALIETNNPEHFVQVDRLDCTVRMSNEKISLSLGGFIPWDYQNIPTPGGAPNLYVSKLALESWSPDAFIFKVFFDVDDAYETQALQTLTNLFGQNNQVSVLSKLEKMKQASAQSVTFSVLGGGLSMILAFIGILNFLNIMVTSVMARRHEFAILESIGMTQQQLSTMLRLEGLIYAVVSLGLVLSLGSGIIYGAYCLLKQMATYVIFSYPFIPLLVASIIIGLICLVTPVIALNFASSDSVVERLRQLE